MCFLIHFMIYFLAIFNFLYLFFFILFVFFVHFVVQTFKMRILAAVRPYEGEELENNLPHGFHYVIPNNGHGCGADVWYGCLEETVMQFF